MIVTFSPRFNSEVEAIGRWIAQDDPVRAISYIEEVRSGCKRIGEHPRLYPLATGRGTLRRMLFSPYLIFYHVRRRDVFIVSIRHGARDNSRLR